jgi:glutathione reductase (NADPH)
VEFTRTLGVEFVPHASVISATESAGALRVDFTCETGGDARECHFILNAAGRDPAIDELDLAAAGVERWRRGVLVDDFLRSRTNRRVFAGGDSHGILQLSPVASYEGRIIVRNFLERDVATADYTTVPQAIYTTPPLATVGLTETEARVLLRPTAPRFPRTATPVPQYAHAS